MFRFAAIGYAPFLTRNTKTPALELQILTKLFRGFLKFFSILFHVKTPIDSANFVVLNMISIAVRAFGEKEGARTLDPRNHNPLLQPTELLSPYGAGGEIRTHVGLRRSLTRRVQSITMGLQHIVVGREGIGPSTPWASTKCSTRLSYLPIGRRSRCRPCYLSLMRTKWLPNAFSDIQGTLNNFISRNLYTASSCKMIAVSAL